MANLKRGLGTVYRPTYKDKVSGEIRTSAVWWLKYTLNGQPQRESSGETSRAKAIEHLKARVGEIATGDFIGVAAKRTTLGDLVTLLREDYQRTARKSWRRAEQAVAHLRDFFGQDRPAHTITPDLISRYIAQRQDEQVAPATIKYECAILRRLYTLGLKMSKVARKPYVPSIEVSNTRTGFFTEAEITAVLGHLPEAVAPVVEFLYLTGWRVGEALPLQWRQLDFRAKTVRLEPGTTKNDEGRTFPFGRFPRLRALLERQRERTLAVEKATGRIIPHVFHRGGEPILDFRGAWERACTEAGLAGRLVHDLRRCGVRNLERSGVSRSVAMKLTGHKTEAVYRRYAIVSEADLSEGVAKLARLHEQHEPEPRVIVPVSEASGKVRAKSAAQTAQG